MQGNHITLGRYWYFLDNMVEAVGEIGEATLFFSLPVNTRGQSVRNVRISPEPAHIIDDLPNGNRIVVWRTKGFSRDRSDVFWFDFELRSEEVNFTLDPDLVEPCDPTSPEYRRYTISEGWLDINDELRAKSREILSGETNPCRQAKRIFDWVVRNMKYEYPDMQSRGASLSLKRLKGDCAEFSAVFISLCRCAGIPARPVTCNWHKGGGHQWAEIYLRPYGWVPVDPTIANVFMFDPEGGLARKLVDTAGLTRTDPDWFFGNLYPNRIIVLIGENIDCRLPSEDKPRLFYLLQPGGVEAHPSAAEFRGIASTPIHGGIYLFGDARSDEGLARTQAQAALAESYFQAKMYDKAAAGFVQSLKEKPKSAHAWLLLGQVYMATGEYPKAITAFRSSIAGEGGSLKPVWEALAHFHIGNCHDLAGDREAAKAEYATVVNSGVSYENLQERTKKCIEKPYSIDAARPAEDPASSSDARHSA